MHKQRIRIYSRSLPAGHNDANQFSALLSSLHPNNHSSLCPDYTRDTLRKSKNVEHGRGARPRNVDGYQTPAPAVKIFRTFERCFWRLRIFWRDGLTAESDVLRNPAYYTRLEISSSWNAARKMSNFCTSPRLAFSTSVTRNTKTN